MNHINPAAAAAAERYRRTNGQFGEQPHAEAPTPVVDAPPTRIQRLAAAVSDAESAAMAARQRQAYLAGQLLLEQVRAVVPTATEIRFGEDWSGAAVKEVRDADGTILHGNGQHVADLGDLFWNEGQLVQAASDPFSDDDTARFDPDGMNEPALVLVADGNGSVTEQVWPIGLVDNSGGVRMLELYASEEARDAAVIDMAANRIEAEEPPTDFESAVEWLRGDEPGVELLLDHI